ncbi:DNA polymerase IV [Patescibacteria group bacterium]|nr:DNA polymerase IV [Patescibacteria group bacterium]MBU1890646.1 DNA polymerase IV [Patescibacteria group bacterium]
MPPTKLKSIILHIDMNSYFASVEQQANPFLRGRPVGVCAYLSDNGCIIASSIEAKEVGIKVGLRVKDARAIDPDIVIIQNDPAKYRSTTKKIFSILNRYTDDIEPYSIDEAFLDLTGHVKNLNEAHQKAQEIQTSIKRDVGEWLGASVGISFTRFLAKLASDCTGPNSILLLPKRKLAEFYESIELTDIWGINTRMEVRLNHLGIYTPTDLHDYPVANLMQSLGKMGYHFWANLNGVELTGLQKPSTPKSIGHSYCLPRKTSDNSYHRKILMKLCEKTGRRLRHNKLEARGLGLYWRYIQGGYSTHKTLPYPINDSAKIFGEVMKLFHQNYQRYPITMLAVSVFRLQPPSGQLALFPTENKIETPDLVKALDQINNVYGEHSIFWGTMWDTTKNSPDRIGFRKTVASKWDSSQELQVVSE